MIEKNYRMPPPSGTPTKVREVMSKCWEFEAEQRPNFAEIVEELNSCR